MIFNPRIQKSSGPAGTQISTLEVGTLVKINENGAPVEFYLAKHNYEPDLNGQGRELLVRKNVYDQREWTSVDADNTYASSTIDTWLNNTYKNLLDGQVKNAIGTTKFYYTPGDFDANVSTLQRSVFLLSLTELGYSDKDASVEGSALPIASTLRIAYQNGSATTQWTRSPRNYGNGYAWMLLDDGSISDKYDYVDGGSRPCFTLPSTALVDQDLNLIKEVA